MPSTEKYRNYQLKIIWGGIGFVISAFDMSAGCHNTSTVILLLASGFYISEGFGDRKANSDAIKAEFEKKPDD